MRRNTTEEHETRCMTERSGGGCVRSNASGACCRCPSRYGDTYDNGEINKPAKYHADNGGCFGKTRNSQLRGVQSLTTVLLTMMCSVSRDSAEWRRAGAGANPTSVRTSVALLSLLAPQIFFFLFLIYFFKNGVEPALFHFMFNTIACYTTHQLSQRDGVGRQLRPDHEPGQHRLG
jgi:hypothetical protein